MLTNNRPGTDFGTLPAQHCLRFSPRLPSINTMLFGRRDKKKSNDRVLDLKARVDALRAVDEASREKPYTLDHFLEGDDVLTGRDLADDYKPTGFDASPPAPSPAAAAATGADDHFEVNLQAELDKYIRRQEELTQAQADDLRPPAAPYAKPREPEASTFVLDGTWDRDPVPMRPAPDTAASPAGEKASSTPDSGGGVADPPSAWDTSAPTWPDLTQWPAEEKWPPREDEAV